MPQARLEIAQRADAALVLLDQLHGHKPHRQGQLGVLHDAARRLVGARKARLQLAALAVVDAKEALAGAARVPAAGRGTLARMRPTSAAKLNQPQQPLMSQ